jgi:hypothetical protein
VSEFVDQCRQEWRRLGVNDAFAEEMAADLTSDLEDAEAEGVSAADYLGASVFDPQAFAASWASARGLIPAAPSAEKKRRPFALSAFAALAAVTVFVAALLLATGEPKVTLNASRSKTAPPHLLVPGKHAVPFGVDRVQASAAAPVEWILLFVAIVGLGFSAWLWLRWREPETSNVSRSDLLP